MMRRLAYPRFGVRETSTRDVSRETPAPVSQECILDAFERRTVAMGSDRAHQQPGWVHGDFIAFTKCGCHWQVGDIRDGLGYKMLFPTIEQVCGFILKHVSGMDALCSLPMADFGAEVARFGGEIVS